MSLVAYDSSDDSGNENEREEAPSEKIGADVARLVAEERSPSNLFSILPKPNKTSMGLEDISGISRLLLNKRPRRSNRGVKITIPSLSEFEDEGVKPAKVTASTKGSGLFSLLPPPKHNLGLNPTGEPNGSLIPDVIRRSRQKTEELIKSVTPISGYVRNSDDDSDSEAEGDFFKLSKITDPLLWDEKFEVSEPKELIVIDDDDDIQITAANTSDSPDVIPLPVTSDCIPVTTRKLELDDNAIKILCGGKRKREEPMNIIDLCAEEFMPNSREWRIKQLTEEPKTSAHSHRKSAGPSNQSKRKHQITYLAFQAKEQELELQNQWAQNRMTRKQTQSKYGF